MLPQPFAIQFFYNQEAKKNNKKTNQEPSGFSPKWVSRISVLIALSMLSVNGSTKK